MVTILGVLPVYIMTRRAISKERVHTRQLLYIVKELKGTYISREALADLGVISKYFPQVPPKVGNDEVAEVVAIKQKKGGGELKSDEQTGVAPCGCPMRMEAPQPPELPFASAESNREKLKEFLLQYYKSSTFNMCPHQPLPLMQGPPLEFRMKPDAKPYAIYTAATVAVHWEKTTLTGMSD